MAQRPKQRPFLCGLMLGVLISLGPAFWWVSSPPNSAGTASPVQLVPMQRQRLDKTALPPGIPPNAIRREFNGQPYYIIPLAKL